jgi:hypothetical protein
VPDVKVAIDSRIEVFPAKVWDDYDNLAAAGHGWSETLDSWGATIVVGAREGERALIDALSADPNWRQVYSDPDGVIFVRSGRS